MGPVSTMKTWTTTKPQPGFISARTRTHAHTHTRAQAHVCTHTHMRANTHTHTSSSSSTSSPSSHHAFLPASRRAIKVKGPNHCQPCLPRVMVCTPASVGTSNYHPQTLLSSSTEIVGTCVFYIPGHFIQNYMRPLMFLRERGGGVKSSQSSVQHTIKTVTQSPALCRPGPLEL